MKIAKQHDVIIIGGSYAGLSAGMALGRALRNTLIIDSGNPANRQTPYSHNFLTNDGKTPAEIAALGRKQVGLYKSISFLNDLVIDAHKTEFGFEVAVRSGRTFQTRKLVFATGIKDILPNIPGVAECWGISVLHCPYCHGYEVRNEITGILANGEKGFEFAGLISNWTKNLTLFTNGKSTLTGDQILKLKHHKIEIVEKEIDRVAHREGRLSKIIFRGESTAALTALYAPSPFEQHCLIPISLGCKLTDDGYILTDAMQRTTVPGVYACGDNVSRMRTVANALSLGAAAGMMVNKELLIESF